MTDVRENTTAIDHQHGGRGPRAVLERRADDVLDVERLRLARHQKRNERHHPSAQGMVRRHNGSVAPISRTVAGTARRHVLAVIAHEAQSTTMRMEERTGPKVVARYYGTEDETEALISGR